MNMKQLDERELNEGVSVVLDHLVAGGGAVVVERRGKAVAAIVSMEDFRVLEALTREQHERLIGEVLEVGNHDRERIACTEEASGSSRIFDELEL